MQCSIRSEKLSFIKKNVVRSLEQKLHNLCLIRQQTQIYGFDGNSFWDEQREHRDDFSEAFGNIHTQ